MKVLSPEAVSSSHEEIKKVVTITEFDSFEDFCSICDPLFMSQMGMELVWFNKHNFNDQPHLADEYPKFIHALIGIKEESVRAFLKTFKGVDNPSNKLKTINFKFGDVAEGIKKTTSEGTLIYLPCPRPDIAKAVLFNPKSTNLEYLMGWVINKTTVVLPGMYFSKRT